MTKTPIRGVPAVLPHASIYIDDLIEIESILSSEFLKVTNATGISFEYEVNGTDRMTTHDELLEHGGHCSKFTMNVVVDQPKYTYERTLVFNGSVAPEFKTPSPVKSEEWAVFGRVEQVFETRGNRGKHLTDLLPGPLFGVISAAFLMLSMKTVFLFGLSDPTRWNYLVLSVSLGVLGALIIYFVLTPNRVHFRYVRQDQKERHAAWKKRIERLLWTLLGAALALIGEHLKH